MYYLVLSKLYLFHYFSFFLICKDAAFFLDMLSPGAYCSLSYRVFFFYTDIAPSLGSYWKQLFLSCLWVLCFVALVHSLLKWMCPSILLTVSSFVSTGTGEKNGHGKIKLLENRFSSWQYYSLKDNSHQSPSDNLRSTKPAELTKDGRECLVGSPIDEKMQNSNGFFFFFPRPKGQSPNSFAAKVRCSQLGQRKSLLTGSPNGPELEEKMTASQAPRNVTSVTLLLFNSFIVFDIMAAFSQWLLGGGGGRVGGGFPVDRTFMYLMFDIIY